MVVPVAGATVDAAELIAYAREELAHFKCPAGAAVVDALPRNASGKLLKTRLRTQYATVLTGASPAAARVRDP